MSQIPPDLSYCIATTRKGGAERRGLVFHRNIQTPSRRELITVPRECIDESGCGFQVPILRLERATP